jgi:hypothetical protein
VYAAVCSESSLKPPTLLELAILQERLGEAVTGSFSCVCGLFLPAYLNAGTGMLGTNGFRRIMFRRALLLPATPRTT